MSDKNLMVTNYFKTPADPEGFVAPLSDVSLRNIDYSALEFSTLQRAIIEYVKTYHRDKFNDFVSSNGFMMLTELVCYVGSVLSQRADIIANEAFLPTSFTANAVVNHLNLIGQKLLRKTPATIQVMCTIDSPIATDIRIKTNGETFFNVTGRDGRRVSYEIYSAPYDWTSDIVIPARKYGVVAWGLEGRFADPYVAVSGGGPNQKVIINGQDILEEPIIVTVDNIPWSKVDFLGKYGANDRVYQVKFDDNHLYVLFGDNISGMAPLAGQEIRVRYRVGGGTRGRINAGDLNQTRTLQPEPPSTATVTVQFRNYESSIGGYDGETIEQAKRRAPQTWATHGFIATSSDYITEAVNFKHPVYGSVMRAAATVHTSINANVVRVAILVEGADGKPALPNVGMKKALASYLNKKNVLTDDVDVVDGKIKSVDVDMSIVIYRNIDASLVKSQIDGVINSFFDLKNWEMGKPLYVSSLYDMITAINGVYYVDIFEPVDDILPRKNLQPEKINSANEYNEAKRCWLSGPYQIDIIDGDNFTFIFKVLTPGVRQEDAIAWALYNCGLYIGCSDCIGGHGAYEFRTFKRMSKYVVDWDELIVLGNKNVRIYYEKGN